MSEATDPRRRKTKRKRGHAGWRSINRPSLRDLEGAQKVKLMWSAKRRDRRDEVCYIGPGQSMKYDLFIRVALAEDLPERRLRRGDVATVVEFHTGRPGQ